MNKAIMSYLVDCESGRPAPIAAVVQDVQTYVAIGVYMRMHRCRGDKCHNGRFKRISVGEVDLDAVHLAWTRIDGRAVGHTPKTSQTA